MCVDPTLARPYYRAALAALRHLDERTGRRRFGLDADARWSSFAGDDPADVHGDAARIRVLGDLDRIDLLLRDADAQWPRAFGARTVFDLTAVAEDDAFGAQWSPGVDGHALWQEAARAPLHSNLADLLRGLAALWDVPLTITRIPPPRPTDRWLLHGASATAGAIVAFTGTPDATWHTQVLVVAEPPLAPDAPPQRQRHRAFARQLAALAAALLGQNQPTRLLATVPAADEHPGYQRLGAAQGAA